MIPQFTSDGTLPPGIHTATLSEFEQRFAVFNRTDRRLRIFEQLSRLVQQVRAAGFVRRIIVGGSFVTSTASPGDFDCIFLVDQSIANRELRPFEYNLLSRRMVRRAFGGDVLVALEGSEAFHEYLRFFQTTRDGKTVGIVELVG